VTGLAIGRVPAPARILGFSGLIPFWAAALAPFVLPDAAGFFLAVQTGYAAVILAFMGAVHWGLQMASGRADTAWERYGGSVVPPLLGWVALLLPPLPGLLLFAASFAGLYAFDLREVRAGRAPDWYPALRLPLTALVVLALLVTAARVAAG
jgi:hypothetical protein